MQKIIGAEKSDLFDVLAHVAYGLAALGRPEEIGNVFSRFQKYLYQQLADAKPSETTLYT